MKKIFTSVDVPLTEALSDRIKSLLHAEKIFLLSVLHCIREPESIFLPSPILEHAVESYLVLVLVSESNQESIAGLRHLVSGMRVANSSILPFVMPIQQFNEWLLDNHPFATRVYRLAGLLFDANTIPLAIPDNTKDQMMQRQNPKRGDPYFAAASGCLSICQEALAQIKNLQALEAMQKAADTMFAGIICAATGLEPEGYPLIHLREYCMHFMPAIVTVFPCDNIYENELFKLLVAGEDKLYSTVPSHDQLVELSVRIEKLLALCRMFPFIPIDNT